jgi:hypothetical protein
VTEAERKALEEANREANRQSAAEAESRQIAQGGRR